VKRDPVILIVVAVVISIMLVFGISKSRHSSGAKGAGKLQGQPAPDFSLASLDGKTLKLSDYRGKAVLLNFWATWCVPCIREIPNFNRFSAEWASKGIEVVGVALDEEGATTVKPFLRKHPIKYRVALGSEVVSEKFQATPLPTTIVFDRHGKTIQRFQGFAHPEAIEAAVRQAL